MDTSDSKITFDARGWCDYCNNYHANILPNWHPDERGEREIAPTIEEIKRDGRGRDHDCIIGISGGVDSSYVTYLAKEKFGLRPLMFHVDAGWNSQQAVNNIEKLVDGLGLDLHTEVVDWLEMQDLQLAFFKAQVPHLDTPQDHAFFAALYNFAAKHGLQVHPHRRATIRLSACASRSSGTTTPRICASCRDIHRRFGTRPLRRSRWPSIFTYKLYYRYVKGMRVRQAARTTCRTSRRRRCSELVERFGWQRYAHKHYESRFTRFYEGYWLPTKFGYDKRRAHFSSLILTQQMTREEALERIAQPGLRRGNHARRISSTSRPSSSSASPQLRALMAGENKSYRDYKSACR